jgi:hypothetical protein
MTVKQISKLLDSKANGAALAALWSLEKLQCPKSNVSLYSYAVRKGIVYG